MLLFFVARPLQDGPQQEAGGTSGAYDHLGRSAFPVGLSAADENCNARGRVYYTVYRPWSRYNAVGVRTEKCKKGKKGSSTCRALVVYRVTGLGVKCFATLAVACVIPTVAAV